MRARLALIAVVLVPSVAQAKYAFQGLATLSAGWTSNAAGTPSSTGGTSTDNATPVESDFFFIVNPTVVFTSALPRALQRVSYSLSAQLYLTRTELDSINNRLAWSGFFTPSENTQLITEVYVTQAQFNTVNLLTLDSASTPIQVTRPGTQDFWGAGANQSLIWSLSKNARLVEALGFTALIPTTAGLGDSYTASGGLGYEYLFRKDAFGGDFKLDYIYYQQERGPITNTDGTVNPDGVVAPTRQQLSFNLLAKWRRDFGHFWNTSLDAGVMLVMRADDGGGRIWQPAGAAAVHYLNPKVQADLSYSHGAAPNAIVQQTFISDVVALRGAVPFGVKSHVSFSASASYSHGRIVDSDNGSIGGAIDLVLVDGTLAWAPIPGLSIFTRYQYQNQLSDQSQTPPLPSIERHIVMLGLTGVYPVEAAAVVPSRAALRVDGSDQTGIPDLHTPAAR
jgi:hypothetical protein